ncbi:MAG TPA: phosphoribosylaminoimidazolesuccinocarboxamide synthase [Syntrophales bacterium]|nr:phosphoribosylaminoimidazolesuccinocarboxamide synthase [Syntrophales bacterium]
MDKKGISTTDFRRLKLLGRGKVRDIYQVDDRLLIVATDRISAFDVIMPDPIPGKGEILTRMSVFWFGRMRDIVENHLISADPADFPAECRPYSEELKRRAMLVKKAKPLPIECVVRGYLAGSGWKDYMEKGAICGIELPGGLKESAKLPEPLFTPSTKAPEGMHDMPITRKEMEDAIGAGLTKQIVEISIAIYIRAARLAEDAGIVIADTKMEFGIAEGRLTLIDELLTPDSSRFWPKDDYHEGRPQKSFDKQFLRDYLISIKWNQKPPAPELPDEVINKTKEKYEEALRRLVR